MTAQHSTAQHRIGQDIMTDRGTDSLTSGVPGGGGQLVAALAQVVGVGVHHHGAAEDAELAVQSAEKKR
jgi:hypothetical protein